MSVPQTAKISITVYATTTYLTMCDREQITSGDRAHSFCKASGDVQYRVFCPSERASSLGIPHNLGEATPGGPVQGLHDLPDVLQIPAPIIGLGLGQKRRE